MIAFKSLVGFILLAVIAPSSGAQQITLSLDVQPASFSPPANVFIDVKVSGLQSADELLGGWEFEFVYDPDIFNFNPVPPAGFGSALGNAFSDEARSFLKPPVDGEFYAGVVSQLEPDAISCVFCAPPYLEDLQGGSITLVTIGLFAPAGTTFEGLTLVEVRNVNLSDESGRAITGVIEPSAAIAINDTDADDVGNSTDNCTLLANPAQRDTDGDNIGNFCDPDVAVPNNCQVDFADLNVYKGHFFQSGDLDTDNNGDGVTNFADLNLVKSFFFGPPGPSAIGCN